MRVIGSVIVLYIHLNCLHSQVNKLAFFDTKEAKLRYYPKSYWSWFTKKSLEMDVSWRDKNGWFWHVLLSIFQVRLDQKMRQLEINAVPASNGGPASGKACASVIDRIENDIYRMRRTIHLLISVGLIFCICWLPLNILNIVSCLYFAFNRLSLKYRHYNALYRIFDVS